MGDSTSKKRARPDDGPSFEVALARLEAIVEKLDDGNLPLAQALSLYKEGNMPGALDGGRGRSEGSAGR